MRHQPPVHSPLTLPALAAGMWTMVGGRAATADRAREWLRARFGAASVLLTDSGTSALTLALRTAARQRSVPVALPAYCCYDVATAADGAGVPIVLYDLDPLSLGPNFASLQRALEDGARTVVAAHLYGVPVDMDRVRRLAGEYYALVIEDAAQGAGVEFGDRRAGSLGSLGVLSFGRGKGMTAGGGGALLANDETGIRSVGLVAGELEPAGRGVRQLAATAAQWALARPEVYGVPASLPFLGLGETVYRLPSPPREAPAFVVGALEQAGPLADAEAVVRRRHAERLRAALDATPIGLRSIRGAHSATPGCLRLPVLAPGSRDALLTGEARRLGVAPGYPRALADLRGFAEGVQNRAGDFSGARLLAAQLVTLPTHSLLTEADLERLEVWVRGSSPSLSSSV